MKKLSLFITLILMAIGYTATARSNGKQMAYRIHLKMPDTKDSMAFLVHYYGKGGSKIYKSDSADLKNGVADFYSTDSEFVGGSYMILLSDQKTNFEFLMDRGDDLNISAYAAKLPESIQIANSPQNEKFKAYELRAREYGEEQQALVRELVNAKTKNDTDAVRSKGTASFKAFSAYRHKVEQENPNTLLANILSALEKPEVPEGIHYLEDGFTKDSTFAYRYYKAHYWDGFNFQDDRLVYTPLYDNMLEEYMTKMVIPSTDSVIHECDMLLGKVKGTRDLFHYTLWWLTKYIEDSKVMGINDVFVYLAENYYMKGDAFWLTSDELQKYIDRARKIAPNVIGNVGPEIKLPNVNTNKSESMHAISSPYTLLVIYSPNCGHCQHEIPLLDSVYESSLKAKGVKIFTVATEGEQKVITDFLTKNKVDKKWINTWDPENIHKYHNDYDIYSTPTIYLLDDKKIIRGKRLDHSNIGNVIDMLERKAKDKNHNK